MALNSVSYFDTLEKINLLWWEARKKVGKITRINVLLEELSW